MRKRKKATLSLPKLLKGPRAPLVVAWLGGIAVLVAGGLLFWRTVPHYRLAEAGFETTEAGTSPAAGGFRSRSFLLADPAFGPASGEGR